jgi:class I fructose-bisphosphate aldolase
MSNELRLSRLYDGGSFTSTMIAVSNSFYYGPAPGLDTTAQVRSVLRASIDGGADAVMITPGALRANLDLFRGRDRPGIVLSAGYTNAWRAADRLGHAGRATDQRLYVSVEEAVRLGVDAFHVYAFLGYSDSSLEAGEVERVGRVCEAARSWGLPVLCEPLVRGDLVDPAEANRVEYVALAARVLSEVGVDMVKVEYTGDPESFAQVVASSHVPVVMMGGAPVPTFDGFLDMVGTAISSGARGLAVGRNVYSQPDAAAAVRSVVDRVRSSAVHTDKF